MSNILEQISIYVGTYQKYNEANLFGEWLTLSDYEDLEAFYTACKELHEDETDPELMFQDWECPDLFKGCISESHLQKDIFEIATLLEDKSEEDLEIIQNYLEMNGLSLNENTIEQAQERYMGYFSNEEAFAEYYAQEIGLLTDIPHRVAMYFDYQSFGRDLVLNGDFSECNGHYFREF